MKINVKTSRRNERRERESVISHICLFPFVLKLNKNGVCPQFLISTLFFFNKFPHVVHVTIQTSMRKRTQWGLLRIIILQQMAASTFGFVNTIYEFLTLLFNQSQILRLHLRTLVSTSTDILLFYCVLVSIIRKPGSRHDGASAYFVKDSR